MYADTFEMPDIVSRCSDSQKSDRIASLHSPV